MKVKRTRVRLGLDGAWGRCQPCGGGGGSVLRRWDQVLKLGSLRSPPEDPDSSCDLFLQVLPEERVIEEDLVTFLCFT
ncbi:unnamed protein product [Pleuronectes platessa]|uniref:Uncharacterized protein n=1 Tax=Pleuronectes platessa TaxID=8262 RepID=A0A9N7UT74_PLEPL|nr:unnamed protein product [Pleuronectes platessa]